MSSTIGPEGLSIATYEQIREEKIADFKALLGDNIRTQSDSKLGNIIDTASSEERVILELFQQLTEAFDVTKAVDLWLDALLKYLGIERASDSFSTVALSLTATAGTVIPAGSLVSDADSLFQWATDSEVIATGSGDTVNATCTTIGAVEAAAGTITAIVNPVFGWTAVTNASDASVGTDRESNSQARRKHETVTQAIGKSSIGALFLNLSKLENMSKSTVFANTGDTVDSDGVPPGYVWSVCVGANNADIAKTIFDTIGGIQTFGSTTVAHTDPDMNQTYEINFEIATAETLYCEFSVETNSFFTTSEDTIKQAISDYVADLEIGGTVRVNQIIEIVMNYEGVVDVVGLKLDTTTPPTATSNITVDRDKFPQLTVSNITIV